MAQHENDFVTNNVFRTMGASGHALLDRQIDDYYATDPVAINLLVTEENFNKNILEPACGQGHFSKRLQEFGFNVTSSDLVDRGFGVQKSFFDIKEWNGDIITNPPYKDAVKFIKHALDIVPDGAKIAMFLKLLFLESRGRKEFFKLYSPRRIYVCSGRVQCALNGDFDKFPSSTTAYAWYVWEKGYYGRPMIDWIN